MQSLLLLEILVVAANCILDPYSIPRFATTITNHYRVFKPSSNSTSSQHNFFVSTKLISQQMLPEGFPPTEVYAYGGEVYDFVTKQSLGVVYQSPGPLFVLPKNVPARTTWENGLKGKHMFTLEKNLDYMDKVKDWDRFIPNVPHAHGMANPAEVDGVAEAWWTAYGEKGNQYHSD